MSNDRHGLHIGVERSDGTVFLFFKAVGRLTHADYDEITPVIESALAGVCRPRVHALVDATQLEGWEPQALWDDFRLGLRHGSAFEKIASGGGVCRRGMAGLIGRWDLSGDVRFFIARDAAVRWLAE